MNHEPECPWSREGIGMHSDPARCHWCTVIRAGHLRGMEDAAKVADHRKDELGWCSKRDRCHTMSQGADLAASDIRFRANELRTRWEQA